MNKQNESMRCFIGDWTSIGLLTDDEYINEKYPQVYEAAARIALDQAVIDAACDDMRARIDENN